jgi:hypothetical protein
VKQTHNLALINHSHHNLNKNKTTKLMKNSSHISLRNISHIFWKYIWSGSCQWTQSSHICHRNWDQNHGSSHALVHVSFNWKIKRIHRWVGQMKPVQRSFLAIVMAVKNTSTGSWGKCPTDALAMNSFWKEFPGLLVKPMQPWHLCQTWIYSPLPPSWRD